MTEVVNPPTLSEMEDALAHYGVKGMKWGQRKSESSGPKAPAPKAEAAKYIGKELAFGSIGPVALILGAGPPISIALGVGVAAARSPAAKAGYKAAGNKISGLMSDIKNTPMSEMRTANVAYAKNN